MELGECYPGQTVGGTVKCNLCCWDKKCTTMEQMEYFLRQHLWLQHGRRLKYRAAKATGIITEIPE